MNWIVRIAVLAALVAAIGAPSTSSASSHAGSLPTPQPVAAWPLVGLGSFAESMTLGKDGHLYVSRTTWGEESDVGSIERVPVRGGPARTFVSGIDAGLGLIAGLTVDGHGRLYVAVAAFSDSTPTGVFRVDPNGRVTPVLLLPEEAFPNGLAFHDGYLYVTDPVLGAVWRVLPQATPVTQTDPWLVDPALAPGASLGPDGIAFRGDTMYLTQYDRGQILTTVVGATGSWTPLHVLAVDPALVTADGIAFDRLGNLWATVNGDGATDLGRIVLVTPAGAVQVLADNPGWLDYPTQPVFAPEGLFVANGSYGGGAPSVVGWPTK